MPFSILGSSGELSPVGLGLRLCSLDLECQGCGGEGGYCLLGLRFDSSRVWRCSVVSTSFIGKGFSWVGNGERLLYPVLFPLACSVGLCSR